VEDERGSCVLEALEVGVGGRFVVGVEVRVHG
jgi:hypothetical protein